MKNVSGVEKWQLETLDMSPCSVHCMIPGLLIVVQIGNLLILCTFNIALWQQIYCTFYQSRNTRCSVFRWYLLYSDIQDVCTIYIRKYRMLLPDYIHICRQKNTKTTMANRLKLWFSQGFVGEFWHTELFHPIKISIYMKEQQEKYYSSFFDIHTCSSCIWHLH